MGELSHSHSHASARRVDPILRDVCHLGLVPFLWPSWVLQGQQTHLGQQGRKIGRIG